MRYNSLVFCTHYRHSDRCFLYIATAIIAFFSHVQAFATPFDDLENLTWRPFAEHFEVSDIDIDSLFFFNSHITLLRFTPEEYRIAVIRASDFGLSRGSVRTLCQKSRAIACINANFFDENGKALGLVVTRGMTLQGIHKGGKTLTGIFQISRSIASIINRTDYNPESIVEAVQAGPRLVANNQKIPGLKEESSATRRSGVCIDQSNRIIFYVMSTGFLGLSLEELREFLLSNKVQCREALNLDGGGSTQLYIESRSQTQQTAPIFIEGIDEVPVVLGVFPRTVP